MNQDLHRGDPRARLRRELRPLPAHFFFGGCSFTLLLKSSKPGPNIWARTSDRSFDSRADRRYSTISGEAAFSLKSMTAQASLTTGWAICPKCLTLYPRGTSRSTNPLLNARIG